VLSISGRPVWRSREMDTGDSEVDAVSGGLAWIQVVASSGGAGEKNTKRICPLKVVFGGVQRCLTRCVGGLLLVGTKRRIKRAADGDPG
jgi:hypothetical protein